MDDLLEALDANRAGRVAVAVEDVRLTLQGAKERGWVFDAAWSAAINRVQPTNNAGVPTDPVEARELAECKALLEEDRVAFRAAYEGRPLTERERAAQLAASLERLDLPLAA